MVVSNFWSIKSRGISWCKPKSWMWCSLLSGVMGFEGLRAYCFNGSITLENGKPVSEQELPVWTRAFQISHLKLEESSIPNRTPWLRKSKSRFNCQYSQSDCMVIRGTVQGPEINLQISDPLIRNPNKFGSGSHLIKLESFKTNFSLARFYKILPQQKLGL